MVSCSVTVTETVSGIQYADSVEVVVPVAVVDTISVTGTQCPVILVHGTPLYSFV